MSESIASYIEKSGGIRAFAEKVKITEYRCSKLLNDLPDYPVAMAFLKMFGLEYSQFWNENQWWEILNKSGTRGRSKLASILREGEPKVKKEKVVKPKIKKSSGKKFKLKRNKSDDDKPIAKNITGSSKTIVKICKRYSLIRRDGKILKIVRAKAAKGEVGEVQKIITLKKSKYAKYGLDQNGNLMEKDDLFVVN